MVSPTNGSGAPGTRLGQAELAERLEIPRTPVRETQRRTAGRVARQPRFRTAGVGLDAMLRRLDVRLILEPGDRRRRIGAVTA